jgi:hypothetical protein
VRLLAGDKILKTVTPDYHGDFSFENVPPGEYWFHVQIKGYYPAVVREIIVREGWRRWYDTIGLEKCPTVRCDPRKSARAVSEVLVTCTDW